MKFNLTSQRSLFLTGFLLCAVLIMVALYFQHVMGFDPCPLCIIQRIAIMVCGAFFLIAFIHNPKPLGRAIYHGLIILGALFGLTIAGRQVWLQHLPKDQVPACGPGLDYMLEVFPLMQALEKIFKGSGECAEVHWTFLSLSIAGWMMVIFTSFIIASITMMIKRHQLS